LFHKCDLECKEYKFRDHPIPGRWGLGEMEFNRCPLTYVTENVTGWLIAHSMFQKGLLPNAGGWMQQSNKFIEVMFFLDAEIKRHNEQGKK